MIHRYFNKPKITEDSPHKWRVVWRKQAIERLKNDIMNGAYELDVIKNYKTISLGDAPFIKTHPKRSVLRKILSALKECLP